MVENRKFYTEDEYFKKHIENIGKKFIIGYNTALIEKDLKKISKSLNDVEKSFSGFSFEGAAMALVICDFFNPWKNNFNEFLKLEKNHEYMMYVGAGWAVARLPFKRLIISKLNKKETLHKLVFDGIGFHQGYFNWQKFILNKDVPKYLNKNELKSYYQGLGRSFWFVFGGNAKKIEECIETFEESVKGDLWSGIGLASTYAGGRQDSIKELKKLSNIYFPDLAQGCTFAAKARKKAENITVHNKYSCEMYCGMTIEEASKITDDCLDSDYEVWRQKIRKIFS